MSSASVLRNCEDFLRLLKESTKLDNIVKIVAHFDADGLSSAGILCGVLSQLDIPFQLRVVKQLDIGTLNDLAEESRNVATFIFVDLGSGQKNLILERLRRDSKAFIVVIDHHVPASINCGELLEVNPHLLGIDGSRECSTSTACFYVAKAAGLFIKEAAKLAIVGSIGDRQDCGERSSLMGLNAEVAREAEELGVLRSKISLKLFGAETRPISKALEHTADPYIPGLTGNEVACEKFLERLGLLKEDNRHRALSDLSEEELRKLASELVNHLLLHGINSKSAESLIGRVYIFLDEPEGTFFRDAREYAFALNACGRMGRSGLGISICLGDRHRARSELMETISQYRRLLSQYLDWLYEHRTKISEGRYIRSFHAGDNVDEKLLSSVVSIAASTIFNVREKVLIGFASASNYVKASIRGGPDLISMGVNLGDIARKVAELVGGLGGGHASASGAQIPAGSEEEFLKLFEEELSGKIEHAKTSY